MSGASALRNEPPGEPGEQQGPGHEDHARGDSSGHDPPRPAVALLHDLPDQEGAQLQNRGVASSRQASITGVTGGPRGFMVRASRMRPVTFG